MVLLGKGEGTEGGGEKREYGQTRENRYDRGMTSVKCPSETVLQLICINKTDGHGILYMQWKCLGLDYGDVCSTHQNLSLGTF